MAALMPKSRIGPTRLVNREAKPMAVVREVSSVARPISLMAVTMAFSLRWPLRNSSTYFDMMWMTSEVPTMIISTG